MIPGKRYGTSITKIANEFECTDYIENIQNPLPDIAEPYCMGYMTYQEYPKFFNVNNIIASSEQSPIVKFDPVVENHSWGYCYFEPRTGVTSTNSMLFYRTSSDTISKLASRTTERVSFINKMIAAKQTNPDRIILQCIYMVIRNDCYSFDGLGTNVDPDDGAVTNLYKKLTVTAVLTYAQIQDAINGDIPIFTANTTVNGTAINMPVYYNDSAYDHEHNIFIKQFDSDYTVVAIIQAAALGFYGKYDGFSSDSGGYSAVSVFVNTSIPDHSGSGGTIPEQSNAILCPFHTTSDYLIMRFRHTAPYNWYDAMQNNMLFENGMAVGCFPYEFDASKAIAPVCHDPNGGADYGFYYDRSGLYQNSILIEFNTDYNPNLLGLRFFNQIDLQDVFRAACLINKIEIGATSAQSVVGSTGYDQNNSVALFDIANYPLNTRKSDTYSVLLLYLQEWQKINTDISINDYDPADLPPYDPSPQDDDERSFGVDYEPNRAYSIGTLGGFITQYAMTQDQIAQFGHYLWAAFDDEDFWESISVILPESLSLNPSDILKYIVSVRMFPFSLSEMPSFSPGTDSKIYIGRGFKPIDIHTQMNVGTIDSYTEDIDGGYADIPAFHGDFRDYEPCARATVTIPFCGSLELVPSQIIGARVHLRYGVDYSTGAVQATVTVENGKKYIAGILNGSIGATVQMTASNLSQVLQGGIKAGTEIVKGVAMIAAGVASASAGASMTDAEAITSSEIMAQAPSAGVNSINSILSLDSVPPQQISMSNGFASMQVTGANVRLEFRHYTKPSNYAHTHGYACDKTVTLGSLEGKGFTVCKNVDLTGVPATQEELAILEQLLQSGVYL